MILKNFAHPWRESWGWAWGALCPAQPASSSSSPRRCEPPPSPTFSYSPHFCFKSWIIWKSLQVLKSIMVRAKIPPVLDTSAPCFYLCSPNRKYLQGLSFMAVYDKGTCQKLLSGFCPLRGWGYPAFPLSFFWAQWLSVKGGSGTPQFR